MAEVVGRQFVEKQPIDVSDDKTGTQATQDKNNSTVRELDPASKVEESEGSEKEKNPLSEDENDKKVSLEARNEFGYTNLQWAAINGELEKVKYLISEGADIESRDSFGNTVLLLATQRGHLEVVKEILKYKPNLEARNMSDETALKIAQKMGDRNLVKSLKIAKKIK